MSIRSEKQFRAEHEGKYAPATIDLLVKAEREAGKLKASEDEDEDEDEGEDWDNVGDRVAKAREAAIDAISKAEAMRVDVLPVREALPTGSQSPEQRPLAERTPIPDSDIDDIPGADILWDIAKAVEDATRGPIEAMGERLVKAFGDGLKNVVKRFEARIGAQDTLIKAVLDQNSQIAKAARKQGTRTRDILKALDTSPAPRTPKYTLDQVEPLPRPGDPTPRSGAQVVDAGDLQGWIVDKLDTFAKANVGSLERQQMAELKQAMHDLDAGTRSPDAIAKAVGFTPPKTNA